MSRPAASFALLLVTACAPAQVTLSTVQGGGAAPAGALYDFGPVALGGVADAVFRLTNTGPQGIYLTSLSLAGSNFSVVCRLSPDLCGARPLQQLPILIGPGGTLDFTVRFQPLEDAISSSANMTIVAGNTVGIILAGKIVLGLSVGLDNQPLVPGQTLSFGNVEIGSSQTMKLVLSNRTHTALVVPAIPPLVGSGDFSLSGAAVSASTVAPGGSAELDVTFTPTAVGPRQATLAIGSLSYPLQGTGLALPVPSIQLDLATYASARQGSLAVNLASAAAAAAMGTVNLTFQPAVAGVARDPSVAFADGTGSAAFTVAQGATAGQFASGPAASFGTGTTAGALLFTVTLGNHTAQEQRVILPVAVAVDAAVAARNVSCDAASLYCTASNVELQINGWDNTRSASRIVLTFFDSSGNPVPPGSITVDAGPAFQTYFAASDLGGVFGLHALFPVTGDSLRVTGAEVRLINSAGTAQTARIVF